MGKCLLTTLKESVSDTTLWKLGEIRMNIETDLNPTQYTRGYRFQSKEKQTISIISGNAYFTDESLTANKGKSLTLEANVLAIVYISNADCVLSIPNKYALTVIETRADTMHLSVEYSHAVKFDISALSGCTALTNLYLSNSSVSGDISALSGCTALMSLSLSNNSVSGDISALSGCTALSNIEIKYLDISGDLSKLGPNVYFISNQNGSGVFTWTQTRSSSSRIMAMEAINLGSYVDAMLNNQKNCTAYNAGADSWLKRIKVFGTRTSASDAAVATLQEKGYTTVVTSA